MKFGDVTCIDDYQEEIAMYVVEKDRFLHQILLRYPFNHEVGDTIILDWGRSYGKVLDDDEIR